MAEERNLGVARAPERDSDDATELTKEELQRRMDEARESISQTVTEIKETVVNQYQHVKESISDTLDWREQYRRHTVPFTVGAVGVGALLGYNVGGALFGGREDDDYYDADDDYETDDRGGSTSAARSYAAQPVIGAATESYRRPPTVSGAYRPAPPREEPAYEREGDAGYESRPSYGGAYEPQSLASEASDDPAKPGLLERFKETRAYDRLQQEVYTLGDRLVEELSKTARTVVLPALLSRVKDMVGIDLSTQREVAHRSQLEQQTAKASAGTAKADDSASGTGTTGATPTTEPRL